MIGDFSISGVNDSCATFNKIDLHVVDTFSSVVRKFFHCCGESGRASGLISKTYDLKCAYRQVPIRGDHLKFSYFSVYIWELERAQIYRLRTLPFGATHSVYSFLRLARMLYYIAVHGFRLLTTKAMIERLQTSELRKVNCNVREQWFIYTDASYESEARKEHLQGLGQFIQRYLDLRVGTSCCGAIPTSVVQGW